MITSRLLDSVPGIVHGFGSAAELVPRALQQAWERRPAKQQVHGTVVAEVRGERWDCGDADGFFSGVQGVPVSVITADCLPILLARRDGSMVAALHAGWRGLFGGIIETLVGHIAARGQTTSEWVAAIGPAVGSCCYEVSEELAQQFLQRFAQMPAQLAVPRHRHLALAVIAEAELRRLGFGEVDNLQLCTACGHDAQGARRFRSYRKGDRGAQQHAGLLIL